MATASTVTIADLLAHTAWARRLARSLTADADAADDLVQETWIAATQHPPATDRPLRPWLAVVLRNLFIKRSRDILPAPLPHLPVGGAVVYRRLRFPRAGEELISRSR
jgi:predicted RNA polymerase sigma factor